MSRSFIINQRVVGCTNNIRGHLGVINGINNNDGTFDVTFDDGTLEKNCRPRQLKPSREPLPQEPMKFLKSSHRTWRQIRRIDKREATKVEVGYRVMDISNINDKDGTFDAKVYFFFSWEDEELIMEDLELSDDPFVKNTQLMQIQTSIDWEQRWRPLLRCMNLVEAKQHEYLCQPNRDQLDFSAMVDCIGAGGQGFRQRPYLVDPTKGTVVLETLLTGKFRANFNLALFPFDYQYLDIVIAEVEHSKLTLCPTIKYASKNFICDKTVNEIREWELHKGIEKYSNLRWGVAKKKDGNDNNDDDNKENGNADNESSTFTLRIYIRSRAAFYISFIMLPYVFICGLFFLCFTVKLDSLNERLNMAIQAMLAAVAFLYSTTNGLPIVHYINLMGSFFLIGIFLTFFSAIYFGAINTVYVTENVSNMQMTLEQMVQRYLPDWVDTSILEGITVHRIDEIALPIFQNLYVVYVIVFTAIASALWISTWRIVRNVDQIWTTGLNPNEDSKGKKYDEKENEELVQIQDSMIIALGITVALIIFISVQ